MPVDRELAKGTARSLAQTAVSVTLVVANPYPLALVVSIRQIRELGLGRLTLVTTVRRGIGTCNLFLLITSVPNPPPQGDPCPRCRPVTFKLWFTASYGFKKNKNKHEVTFFKAIPAKCGERPPEQKNP